MKRESDSENTEKKQDKRKSLPQLFKKGQSGNPAGRPKGSFSFTTLVRQRLEANPGEAKEIIDYYLRNPRMRELLWKMIDGMPKGSAGDQNVNVNISSFTHEQLLDEAYSLVAEDKGVSVEQLKAS